jgi:LPS export ABC transporter protein LptC
MKSGERGNGGTRARALRCLAFSVPLCLCAPVSGCQQGPDAIDVAMAAADSADQVMIGVRMFMTNQGVRQALLEADTAFVFESTGNTELRKVKITFYTTTGTQSSVLTADEGTYRGRQGNMEGRGNVVVVRDDGARLTTESLTYDQNSNEVKTDAPYVFIQGDRRAEGVGFVSDPNFRDLRTQRVTGTGGGGFRLPQ